MILLLFSLFFLSVFILHWEERNSIQEMLINYIDQEHNKCNVALTAKWLVNHKCYHLRECANKSLSYIDLVSFHPMSVSRWFQCKENIFNAKKDDKDNTSLGDYDNMSRWTKDDNDVINTVSFSFSRDRDLSRRT